jgi:hypothetical protein
MHLLLIIIALAAILTIACLAISNVKRCRPPHRKPRLWKDAAMVLLFAFGGMLTLPAAEKSFLDGVTVSPVGVLKTEHLDGPSQWGAGVDIGKNINPFVSLHVVNLAFRNHEDGNFIGGLLVDETDVQIDAKLSSFSKEKFSLHLVAGGQTQWIDNDYGINAGLRLDFELHKHVSVSAGYSIRTWLKNETRVDSVVTFSTIIKF